MKLWLCTALASITLLLVGCYSLLVVNLGVVNKTAAANGTACLVATHEPDARVRADVSWQIDGGRVSRS